MKCHDFNNIPPEMRSLNCWVLWKYESQRDERGECRKIKVPYQISGKKGSVKDPNCWSSFDDTLKAFSAENSSYDGVGFVFDEGSELMGIDFDHVRNPITGEWDPEALEEIRQFGSYAEVSPSGEGAHVICIAEVPGPRNRRGNREMYDTGRYFTVTGEHIEGTPLNVRPAQKAVNSCYEKWFDSTTKEKPIIEFKPGLDTKKIDSSFDDEIIKQCFRGNNSGIFQELYLGIWKSKYPSQSEADFALCSIIALYTHDQAQINRIFSNSGLYREKWDRPDYKERTINAALKAVSEKSDSEKEVKKKDK